MTVEACPASARRSVDSIEPPEGEYVPLEKSILSPEYPYMLRGLMTLSAMLVGYQVTAVCAEFSNEELLKDLGIHVDEGPTELSNEEIFEGLISGDRQRQYDAFAAAGRRRLALIALALRIARKSRDHESASRVEDFTEELFGEIRAKQLAVDMLGELRAEEAVPFLLDNIDFMPPMLCWGVAEYEGLPCAKALVKIGDKAARAIWRKRLPKADERKLRLYLMVMKYVWGKELCLCLTEAMLEKPLEEQHKRNLEAALRYFEAIPEETGIRGTQTSIGSKLQRTTVDR